MPKPFKSLIIKLADKSGIAQDNPALLDLLSKIDLQADDTLFDGADKFLNEAMGFEAAKNNPILKTHFTATALNGVDDKIKELCADGDLSTEDAAEVLAEKNTFKKIELLKGKVKATLEAKNTGGDKALKKEYDRVNSEMALLKDSQTKELERIKAESEQSVLDYAIDSHLASLQYANSELPGDVNVLTARNLLMKSLAEGKAKLVRADGKLVLKNADAPELDYLDNNKPVSFSDFTNATLAKSKVLKVSEKADGPPKPPHYQKTNGDNKQPDNSAVLNAIQQQLSQPGMQVTV